MNTMLRLFAGAIFAGCMGAAQAIPVLLTQTSPSTPWAVPHSDPLPLTFDLSEHIDTETHTVDSALLSLVFETSGANGSTNSVITVAFAAGTPITGTAAELNALPAFVLGPEAFDLDAPSFTFGLGRGSNAGTVTLTGATLTLTVSLLQNDNPDNPDNPTNPSQSVPEPGTLALLGVGLLGGVLMRRRRA